LLQPVDIGAEFQKGLERGQQKARERAVEGALSHYSLDPSQPMDEQAVGVLARYAPQPMDEQAVGVLARYAPQQLAAMHSIRQKRAQEMIAEREMARRQAIFGKYGSDPAGARTDAIASADTEALKVIDQLDESGRKQLADGARLLEETNPTDQPSYEQTLALAKQAGINIEGAPPEYNPQWVAGIKHLGAVLNKPKAEGQAPSSVREYEYAVEQGYQGTFEQWQQSNGSPIVVDNGDGTKTIIPRNQLGVGQGGGGGTTGGNASGIKAKNNPGALRKPGSMEFQSFGSEGEGIKAQEALLGRYHARLLFTVG
jgi:hypothetical protein